MKDHSPVVSIIVPVYQTEAFLRACVDSVLLQSFFDFELILIDDGSLDESGNICDEYSETDTRIRVFHQKNKGLSAVRNAGIKYARGEYIMMLDSDDVLLSRDYIMHLYIAAMENDAKVSICKIRSFKEGEHLSDLCSGKPDIQIVTGAEIYSGNSLYNDFLRFNTVWAKLYHRTCFANIVFPEGRCYEDVAVMHQIIFPCKRIALVQAEMHGYRVNPQSITRGTKLSELYCDMVMALRERADYFAKQQAIVQYEVAKEIHKKYAVKVFLGVLEEGCIDEIPEEMWPEIDDFRKYHVGSFKFKKTVIESNLEKHSKYIDNLFADCCSEAMQLMQVIDDVFESKHRTRGRIEFTTYNDMKHMVAYAHDRNLVYPVAEYTMKCCSDKNSDLYILCDEYQTCLIREYIQYEHAVRKIIKCAEKSRISLIPVIDNMLDSLYPKPWYRSRKRSVLLMPQSEANYIELDQVMNDAGFSRISRDGDNRDNATQTWENRNGVKISIATDISYGMNTEARCYFNRVCRSMLHEKRPMNEMECVIFLISKIESHDDSLWTTNLADYYDLHRLLSEGGIKGNNEFSQTLTELSLMETFDTFNSLNAKIFNVHQKNDLYDLREQRLLLSVV